MVYIKLKKKKKPRSRAGLSLIFESILILIIVFARGDLWRDGCNVLLRRIAMYYWLKCIGK